MADVQHKRVALKLKQACEETAAQAIAATTASGQASRIHGKNRKFGSRKEATAAKARRRQRLQQLKPSEKRKRLATSERTLVTTGSMVVG
ncbi:hypothetical protein PHYPSEUDO_014034 [Phytophthora pseudosyringae]|uniref:Uncharacterized protein n=1 Tax=Phytophthora pseudosyringae TaxID=221518 RepID=A0A8T1W0Z1_9STRA|nr:hypothetical protein PHYPSEUDO_014034 [Phytophthora pseudosyringae]